MNDEGVEGEVAGLGGPPWYMQGALSLSYQAGFWLEESSTPTEKRRDLGNTEGPGSGGFKQKGLGFHGPSQGQGNGGDTKWIMTSEAVK